jgi:hypothetical protein
MARCAVADWPGVSRRPLACPAEASLEKNGRFRWAAEGCWGLQMGYGVEKMSLEINRRKFTGAGPFLGSKAHGKPLISRPTKRPEIQRKSPPYKRQFTPQELQSGQFGLIMAKNGTHKADTLCLQ